MRTATMLGYPGRTRSLAITAAALGVVLAASACGSSGSGSPASSAGGGTSGGATSAGATPGGAAGKKVGVTLVLKTLANPFFVTMANDARKAAARDNVQLTVAAGVKDGDTQGQINAIGNAISRGDRGILITSNGDAVNAALNQAKQKGIFIIALDTPTNPASTADITYATDNEAAGKLVGQYTAAKLGGKKAIIAMLDAFNDQVISTDLNRDHGFLEGMGIDPGTKTLLGKEAKTGHYTGGKGGDYVIACHQPTQGAIDGGRTAMENCLSANSDINVVYSINEPASEGAYNALKAANKQAGVTIVAIDGSCAGLKFLQTGEFAADAVQYPGKMASLGVDAVAKLARGGAKPTATAGKTFFDTGTALATNQPLPGITSQTYDQAAKNCWGS